VKVGALVAVVAAVVAAAGASPPAMAQTSPPSPIERLAARTASDEVVKAFWRDVMRNAVVNESAKRATFVDPLNGSTRRHIFNRVMRAQQAARLLPLSPSMLGRVGLVGVGAYVGYRIYQHFAGGTETFDLWLDSNALGADSLFNPCGVPFGGWKCQNGWARDLSSRSCDSESEAGFSDGYTCNSGAAWVYSALSGDVNAGCSTAVTGLTECFVLHLAAVARDAGSWDGTVTRSEWSHNCAATTGVMGSSCWWSFDEAESAGPSGSVAANIWANSSQLNHDNAWPRQLAYSIERTWRNVATRFPGSTYVVASHASYPWVNRYRIIVPVGDLLTNVGVEPTAGGTPTATQNYTVPPPYTADPEVPGTEADLDAALNVLSNDPCTRAWVNWVLDPANYTFTANCLANPPAAPTAPATFTLPAPALDETYSSYLSRLRGLGFLGSVSLRVWAPEDAVPELQPDAVTRVKLGTPTSGAPAYDVLTWPAGAVTLNVSHPITVWTNPGPESGPGGGSGGGTEWGDTGPLPGPLPPFIEWCPSCPPVDFGPLMSVDVGSAFPFGAFAWLRESFADLVGPSDDPPVIEYDFPYVDRTLVIDMADFEPAMQIIRPVLLFALIVAFVWGVTAALLRVGGSGD
jgi:hypothetical protein